MVSLVHIHLVFTLAVDGAFQYRGRGWAGQPLHGVPGDAALAGRLSARPAPVSAGE